MFRAAPWTRAPFLTLRYSIGTFFACVMSGVVLATAAASGPLFLASTATAALHNEAAQACPEGSRPGITNAAGPQSYATASESPRALRSTDRGVRTYLGNAGAAEPYRVSTTTVPIAGSASPSAFLYARPGSTAHVALLSGRTGSGVVVPASYARAGHLRLGSTLAVGAAARVMVVGIYRDLAPSAFVPLFRLARYWCAWRDSIVPSPFNRPPPMFLTDDATLVSAGAPIESSWFDPTAIANRTVAEAKVALAATRTALAHLDASRFHLAGDLPAVLDKTARIRAGIGGPVLPIVIASVLVSALIVAASGMFWGLRRQRELRLLSSRGVGPFAIGVKAALELLPALALGCIGGWAAALVIVHQAGPSSLFEPGAPASALLAAAAASLGGVILVAVTGARTVPTDRRTSSRQVLAHVPYELLLLALSVLCYLSIRRDGAVRIVRATVQVNPLVTAFPLLALTGAVLLIGRYSPMVLHPLRRVRPRSPAVYLAARRVTRSPTVAAGVLVAVALPVGVFVYSVAINGSSQRNVDAKYSTNVGAPQAIGLLTHGFTPRPGRLGTIVTRIDTGVTTNTGTDVAVEGIDSTSFTRHAFGGVSLASTAQQLLGAGAPAVLINAPPTMHVTLLSIGEQILPVTQVGRRATFPGLRDPYHPVVLIDRRHLPAANALINRTDEVWTSTADVTPVLTLLGRQGVEANYAISPTTFLNSSGLRPVTWIFSYLKAIATLTAAIGLAGLCYAFTARTRSRARSYHLARRMGMSRATHRRSLVIELGALIAASWLVGAVLALAAIAAVYRMVDAYPVFPPAPSYPPTIQPLLITAAVGSLATLTGARILQRLSDHTNPATVLRT